jgi:preprotein translocase subunit SecF
MPEATAQKKFSCPSCGGEMIQKSKARLIVVGLCMIASVAIAFVFPWFWAPGIILALTGIYLLAWATLGKARWCRNCKKFSVLHQ